jgi:hypothetical protein
LPGAPDTAIDCGRPSDVGSGACCARADADGIVSGTVRIAVRSVVVLIATWLALDLSVPAFPGAFQFDPDDSVEMAGAPYQPLVILAPERSGALTHDAMRSLAGDARIAGRRPVPSRARFVRPGASRSLSD